VGQNQLIADKNASLDNLEKKKIRKKLFKLLLSKKCDSVKSDNIALNKG